MPIYEIEAPDGRKFRIEGDSAPTEQELEEIFSSFSPKQKEQQTQVQQQKLPEVKQEKNDTAWGKFKSMLEERGKQIDKEWEEGQKAGAYYGGKFASGLSLGGSDWARKKYGNIDVEGKYQKYEQEYPPAKNIGTAVEYGSMFLPVAPGNLIFKGASAGVKAIPQTMKTTQKIAKYGYIPAIGTAEGTASGYFATDSGEGAKVGAVLGGAGSLALGVTGGLYGRFTNVAKRIPEKYRGAENLVSSDKMYRVAEEGLKASPNASKLFKQQAPAVYEQLNKDATNLVSNTFGTIDVDNIVAQAKRDFSKQLNETATMPIFNLSAKQQPRKLSDLNWGELSRLSENPKELSKILKGKIGPEQHIADVVGLKGLSQPQRETFKNAWERGLKEIPIDSQAKTGSLLHVQETNKILNDKISTAVESGKMEKVAKLMQIKSQFNDVVSQKGGDALSSLTKPYAEAQRINDFYELGLKMSPTSYKAVGQEKLLKNLTNEQKSAFVKGIVDRATAMGDLRATADTISKNMGALKILDANKAETLSKGLQQISESQDRLKSLTNVATDVLRNKPKTSILNVKKKAEDVLLGKKRRREINYLLKPDKQVAEPNIIPYYNFGQQATNALIRELAREEVE